MKRAKTTTRKRKTKATPATKIKTTKRQKKHEPPPSFEIEQFSHPYGIKPMGNFYFDQNDHNNVIECRTQGLGDLIWVSDALILAVLKKLSKKELCNVSYVSKAFYVLAETEELWHALCIKMYGRNYIWKGTWKRTVLMDPRRIPDKPFIPLHVKGFYSDELYSEWFWSYVDTEPWTRNGNVERRNNLSSEEFVERYEKPNVPVIITDIVNSWPCAKIWTRDRVSPRYEFIFQFGSKDKSQEMKFQNFYTHSEHFKETNPPCIFCDDEGRPVPTLPSAYKIPKYFDEDLFQFVGNDRPGWRWLLIGPARSGSMFHQDPDCSSAWNALLSGRKKFVFYHPSIIPPGVKKLKNFDYAPPPVVIEWFVSFYSASKPTFECVLNPGEILFVPWGYWHMVLNLDETIAITHNYVSSTNFGSVYEYLKATPEKNNLFHKFVSGLKLNAPELLKKVENTKQPSFWETLISS